MNQRNATVSTIIACLKDAGISYELNGATPVSEVLNSDIKAKVRDTLFAMFRDGKVDMSADAQGKYSDDNQLKTYISGLVNNWIRKAPEFNNGGKYVPKNPGSRAGSGDEQIKEMKKLLASTQDQDVKDQIQEAIDARMAEIKPRVEIDHSKLPESLRHLVK